MSLNPTKSRLALLQAVADGHVTIARWSTSQPTLNPGPGKRSRVVKAAIRALLAAGWVWLPLGADEWGRRTYELTSEGRRVLDGATC